MLYNDRYADLFEKHLERLTETFDRDQATLERMAHDRALEEMDEQ